MNATDATQDHQPTAVATPPSTREFSPEPPASGQQRLAAASVIISEQLCEAADLRAGSRVLDVATGTGNAALAAARRCCDVVGLDVAFEGLPCAQQRARAEALDLTVVCGDALALPFADAAFDVVISTLGVMFASDAETAADELVRVCRSGGTIALANWTPDGWSAAVLDVVTRHCPGPSRSPATRTSPFRWGSDAGVRQLLGDRLTELSVAPHTFYARHHNPQSYWHHIRQTSPLLRSRLAEVDPATGRAIERETLALVEDFNRSGDHSVVLAHDYIEVVGTTL